MTSLISNKDTNSRQISIQGVGSQRSRALARSSTSIYKAYLDLHLSYVNDCSNETLQSVMLASVGTEYERPKVSLSCLQCQNRKKKCDKKLPCQACSQAGLSCTAVSRARLPRGRHAAQRDGGDLRQRVQRLEQLLSSQRSASDPVSLTPPADPGKSPPDASWTSISEEVVGIRQLLDNWAGDEPSEPLETPNIDRAQSFDILLYSNASCFVHPHVLESPSAAMVSELLEIYLH
jgi:hypothetical protein